MSDNNFLFINNKHMSQKIDIVQTLLSFRGSIISNWVTSLYNALESDHNIGIISWTPEGNAFVIYDKGNFAKSIMPIYFPNARNLNKKTYTYMYASWERTAHAYGFKSRNEGGYIIWYHKHFKRDDPNLLSLVQRKNPTKSRHQSTKPRQTAQEAQEIKSLFKRVEELEKELKELVADEKIDQEKLENLAMHIKELSKKESDSKISKRSLDDIVSELDGPVDPSVSFYE